MERSKNFQHINPIKEASCNKTDHPSGPLNVISAYWRHRFETEGIPKPRESIEQILAHVMGTNKYTECETNLDEKQLEKLKTLCHRRLMKMPLEYVIGEGEFRGTKLALAPPIFIPEAQTAMLVDFSLKHIAQSSQDMYTVLEIGCGSGAISLSLLRSCDKVRVVAIDMNISACELTFYNARRLEVEDRITILHATLEGDGRIKTLSNLSNDRIIDFEEEIFDFIVSNPPYTPLNDVPKWQREFEDFRARDGGEDGLKIIKPLLLYASKSLKNAGVLFLEIYPTQPDEIKKHTDKHYSSKLRFDNVYKDLSNSERIVQITKIG